MKKFIALLLVAIMAITAVIPAMAAENNDETPATATAPDAPVFYGAQTRVAESKLADHSDVRFIATVSSTTGTCVGYEIVANYYEVGATEPAKTVTYTGEETESTTVYTSVLDNGETKTAGQLVDGAAYIFVVTLTDVPNAQNVDFTVTAYVEYNDEDISSTAEFQRYENGEIMVAKTYLEDFTTSKTNTQVLETLDIERLYGGKLNMSVSGGKLNIYDTTYNDGVFAQLVDRSAFATAPEKYLLEMELEITKYGNISIYFNGTADEAADTAVTKRTGAAIAQLKIDGDKKDDIKNCAGKNFYVRTGYVYNEKSNITAAYGNVAYAIPARVSNNNVTATMKLSFVVDSSVTNGCDIHIFVNGSYLSTRALRGDGFDGDKIFDVNTNSYVSIWAENSITTIDDINVYTFTDEISQTLPTALTSIYSRNFDDCTDLLDECGISQTFGNKYCATGLPLSVTDSGTLSVGSHAWHTDADYFATLVDSGNITNGQTYYFETEFSAINSSSPLGIMIVNNSTTTSSTELQKNGCFIRLETSGGSLTGDIQVTNYNANGTAVSHGDKTYREVTASSIKSGDTKVTLGIIVDSSLANGTLVSVYGNGVFAGSFYMEGDLYDANSNTSIVLWAQQATLTIDNITLKTYSAPIAA